MNFVQKTAATAGLSIVLLACLALGALAADVEIDGHIAAADRILVEPASTAIDAIAAIESIGLVADRVSYLDGTRLSLAAHPAPKSAIEAKEAAFLVARVPDGMSVSEAIEAARSRPGVLGAWPDWRHELFDFDPNDPLYGEYQDNLRQIRMPYAWDYARGEGVIVAVIDSGYRDELSDAAKVVAGYDFRDQDDDPTDFLGHGTLVGNIVAEKTNNGIGCASIAPDARLMPLKVFPDHDDGAYDSDIADAIRYAQDNGAHVINMSLGGGDFSGVSNRAARDARAAGVLLFAASGNNGQGKVEYPAAYDSVIAVGSSRPHSPGDAPARSDFSTYGDALDLVAPGESVVQEGWSSQHGGGYFAASGTSMSSPHAAGLAALLISLTPDDYDPEVIAQVMIETAHRPIDAFSVELGWGEIDARASVDALADGIPNQPPEAHAGADKLDGRAPLTVRFSGAASSDPDQNIEEYRWSLPNMVLRTGVEIEFTFEEGGEFDVVLTVIDKFGKADSATLTLNVDPPKSPTRESEDGGCGCRAASGEPPLSAVFVLGLLTIGVGFARRVQRREARARVQRSRGGRS
ncbi:S8 family serine peptidase [bacterium]|nr:S8 family serine peptidase [bacterium]